MQIHEMILTRYWSRIEGVLEENPKLICEKLTEDALTNLKQRYRFKSSCAQANNTTPLDFAMLLQDWEVIPFLLKTPPKAKEDKISAGYSRAVLKAANLGQTKILQQLLEAGADPEEATFSSDRWIGCRALHVAVLRRNLKMIQLLVNHGANVTRPTTNGGRSPLDLTVVAALKDDRFWQLIPDLVVRPKNAPRMTDEERLLYSSALLAAVDHGQQKAAYALLEAGADPNEDEGTVLSGSYVGCRALHKAVVRRDNKLIELLLKHDATKQGANPMLPAKAKTTNIDTPLGFAFRMALKNASDWSLVITLVEAHPAETEGEKQFYGEILLNAAAYHQTKAVVALLAAGADPNYASTSKSVGSTALYFALLSGDTSMFLALLEAGANPNLENKSDMLPLSELANHRLGISDATLFNSETASQRAKTLQAMSLKERRNALSLNPTTASHQTLNRLLGVLAVVLRRGILQLELKTCALLGITLHQYQAEKAQVMTTHSSNRTFKLQQAASNSDGCNVADSSSHPIRIVL